MKNLSITITVPGEIVKKVVKMRKKFNKTQDPALEFAAHEVIREWQETTLESEFEICLGILEKKGIA